MPDTTASNLLEQARRLPEKDRAAWAGALIESLHGEPTPGADEAWESVILKRVRELE